MRSYWTYETPDCRLNILNSILAIRYLCSALIAWHDDVGVTCQVRQCHIIFSLSIPTWIVVWLWVLFQSGWFHMITPATMSDKLLMSRNMHLPIFCKSWQLSVRSTSERKVGASKTLSHKQWLDCLSCRLLPDTEVAAQRDALFKCLHKVHDASPLPLSQQSLESGFYC